MAEQALHDQVMMQLEGLKKQQIRLESEDQGLLDQLQQMYQLSIYNLFKNDERPERKKSLTEKPEKRTFAEVCSVRLSDKLDPNHTCDLNFQFPQNKHFENLKI